jgi:hypothetical protein
VLLSASPLSAAPLSSQSTQTTDVYIGLSGTIITSDVGVIGIKDPVLRISGISLSGGVGLVIPNPLTSSSIIGSVGIIGTISAVTLGITGNAAASVVGSIAKELWLGLTAPTITGSRGTIGTTAAVTFGITGFDLALSRGVIGTAGGNYSIPLTGNSSVARANLAAFLQIQYSENVTVDNTVYYEPLLPKKGNRIDFGDYYFNIDPLVGTSIDTVKETDKDKYYVVYLNNTLTSIANITTNTSLPLKISFSGNKFTITYNPYQYYQFYLKYKQLGVDKTIINSYDVPAAGDLYKYNKTDDRMFIVLTLTGVEYDEYGVAGPLYKKMSINIEPDYTAGRDAVINITKRK